MSLDKVSSLNGFCWLAKQDIGNHNLCSDVCCSCACHAPYVLSGATGTSDEKAITAGYELYAAIDKFRLLAGGDRVHITVDLFNAYNFEMNTYLAEDIVDEVIRQSNVGHWSPQKFLENIHLKEQV